MTLWFLGWPRRRTPAATGRPAAACPQKEDRGGGGLVAGDAGSRDTGRVGGKPSCTGAERSLHDRIVSLAGLREGWRRVRANGGGAGGDGQALRDFEKRLEEELRRLSEELLAGRYRPGPMRPARMPKADGGWRPLRIPCVRDRVVQASCQLALMQALDGRMHPRSFAYRPRRSVEQALQRLRQDLLEGFVWLVDADIERFFDNVPHRLLRAELKRFVPERKVRRLIDLWLAGFSAEGRGLAQGAPISPLLANLFLHPFDEALAAGGLRFVRYADDFVIACRSREEAEEARRLAARLLERRQLRLHTQKTRIVSAAAGFIFLGQRLRLTVEMQKVERAEA